MCKDNIIITSFAWISPYIVAIFIACGIVATSLGVSLTWGDIVFIPFILTFFLNKKCRYYFEDSKLTVKWLFLKRVIPVESIKQIEVLGTKLGTWIVVKLNESPDYPLLGDCTQVLVYCLRYYRKSFLIPLQRGECDKAVEILQKCFPQEIIMIS